MAVDPNIHPGVTSSMPQWLQDAMNTAWLTHADNPANQGGTQPTNPSGQTQAEYLQSQGITQASLVAAGGGGMTTPSIQQPVVPTLQELQQEEQAFAANIQAQMDAGNAAYLAQVQATNASNQAAAQQAGASARHAAMQGRDTVRAGQTFNPANFFDDLLSGAGDFLSQAGAVVAGAIGQTADVPLPDEVYEAYPEIESPYENPDSRYYEAPTSEVAALNDEQIRLQEIRNEVGDNSVEARVARGELPLVALTGGYGTQQGSDDLLGDNYTGPHGQVGPNDFVVTDLSDVALIARTQPGVNVWYDNPDEDGPLVAKSGYMAFYPAAQKWLNGEYLPDSVIETLKRVGWIPTNDDDLYPIPETELEPFGVQYPAYNFGGGAPFRFPTIKNLTAGLYNWRISA